MVFYVAVWLLTPGHTLTPLLKASNMLVSAFPPQEKKNEQAEQHSSLWLRTDLPIKDILKLKYEYESSPSVTQTVWSGG